MKYGVRIIILVLGFTFYSSALPAAEVTVTAAVLRLDGEPARVISRLDLPPDDLGFAGGRLAIADNRTTGRFLGHAYELLEARAPRDGLVARARTLRAQGVVYVVVVGDGAAVAAVADALGPQVLVVNAAAPDIALRDAGCRPNLFHVAPSRAMLADALAQFLMWKKWSRWVLIEGSHDRDKALAAAFRGAAKKFGAKIVEQRVFEDTGGARRADTGHVLVQRQMPVFTRNMASHDVVVAADEVGIFAAYLPYQTSAPRPVAGSAGLRPQSFHPGHEAWGATQFQRRFERMAKRRIRPIDYQVWLALRVLGEAVTRTGSADSAKLAAFITGPEFELAAFKGQKVTFRPWNRQLRQPVLLTGDRVVVSVSPQPGYLHQRSRLDTLGLDAAEHACPHGSGE